METKLTPPAIDWNETISEMLDGECDNFDVSRVDTPYGRQTWDTYHLIGDVLRSEHLAIRPSDLFNARISKLVAAEPAHHVAQRRTFMRWGVSGAAAVAAVAAIVWVNLPTQPEESSQGNDAAAPVVAVHSSPNSMASPQREFQDYVTAHSQMVGAYPVRQVSYDLGDAQ